MKRWLPTSLSSRLLAVFLITAIAAVILMASLFSRGLGSQWQRTIAPHLVQYVAYVKDDIGSPPDETRARDLAARLSITIQVHQADSGERVFTTSSTPIDVERIKFVTSRRWRAVAAGSKRTKPTPRIDNISIGENRDSPVLRLQSRDYIAYMQIARAQGRGRGGHEMFFAAIGLAVLLGICYYAIRHLLKPIGKLQNTVQQISSGDLAARTHARGHGDLSLLAQSVDQMSERIQQMLNAKRELLLAISHELRSPLTRARVACEMLEPSRHQLKLIKDIDEMEQLIAQLVESERLQNHVVLDLHSHDVSRIVNDIVSSFDTPINWQAPRESCLLQVDETRLQVLVRNLINNALQHGKPLSGEAPEVTVQLKPDNKQLKIVVYDNGPGIDVAHLSSITDAFYRPDASRTRKTGGIGLGLHLCKRIAEAHGGLLLVESVRKEGIGARFTVTLPVQPDCTNRS
ncbi:MAG: sensor histidine kinase [Granulosicoccus sp.]